MNLYCCHFFYSWSSKEIAEERLIGYPFGKNDKCFQLMNFATMRVNNLDSSAHIGAAKAEY